MTRRNPPRSRHPEPEELARLAEAESPPEPGIAGHLAGCRRCMAVYVEFTEMRARMLSESGLEPPPADWLERGMRVAEARPGGRRPADRPRRISWRIPGAAAVAAALLIAVISTQRDGSSEGQRALARQVREDSHGSLLYSEDLIPMPRGIRGTATDEKADATLARLALRYDQGARSRDDVFWLVAGFLSQNDLNNADAHLRESLLASPADARLLNLAAILAFKRNDLNAAAAHLESALSIERSATALLNLAVVRREQGRVDETGELAREAENASPGPEISRLAREIAGR